MSALGVETSVFVWPAVFIGASLLLGVIVLVARRFYMKSLGRKAHEEAFTIDKLDEMCESGQISKDEFERLRRAALGLLNCPGEKGDSQSSASAKLDDEAVDGECG